MNPLLTGILKPQINPQIKQLMQTVKTAQNPQATLQQIVQNNPEMKQVIEYVNANGGDPEKCFYKLVEEKGVNPRDILGQLM